jgi:Ca2+-binding RTX toxin-like protein
MSKHIEMLEDRTLFTVLTFEKTVPPSTTPQPLAHADLNAGYGDRVNGTTQNAVAPGSGVWRYSTTEGVTPKIVTSFGPLSGSSAQLNPWGTGYGDLKNVIYGTSGKMEVTLTADSGYTARLHSFDLAGWPNQDYTIKSVQVFRGTTKVYESLNKKIEGDTTGARHTTISFATPLVGQSLKIVVDATTAGGANIGLDNVRFSQSLAAGTAVLTSGVLTLTGTENSETLSITKSGTTLTAKIGSVTKTFSEASVTSISIDAKGGNDTVSIASTITKPSVILGGTGNDNITGGGGADKVDGGTGADRIAGGGGTDTVNYSTRTASVFVFLDGLANDGASGEKDNVLTDVENILGGSAGDVLYGNSAINKILGGNGNDYIFGGGNNDILEGGANDDQIMGGDGNDTLTGGSGADQLFGEAGNDTLFGRDSIADLLDGGSGTDKAQRDSTLDSVLNIESFIA